MTLALDTLEISKRLKGAGFDEAQADVLVGVLRESREADLARLATKDEFRAEIARLEAAMNAGFAALRAEMEILRRDITIRLGGMIVVATGVLLAAKFFA
jgi:Coiled-coil domain-containing protein 90-like